MTDTPPDGSFTVGDLKALLALHAVPDDTPLFVELQDESGNDLGPWQARVPGAIIELGSNGHRRVVFGNSYDE